MLFSFTYAVKYKLLFVLVRINRFQPSEDLVMYIRHKQ